MVLHLTLDLRAVILGSLLLLAGWVIAVPIALALAEDGTIPGTRAAAGTAFTYQGRFEEDGVPANGTYSFRFTLRSDAVANTTVGDPVTRPVDVTNGHFATALDFGGDAFNGDARWIDVEVESGNSYVALPPRQPLTATPYALYSLETAEHSHFGAIWTGYHDFAGLNVMNTNETIGTYSIFGQTEGEFTAAIAGYAPESAIGTLGVAKYAPNSTRGIGVIGRSFPDGSSPIYGDTDARGSGVYGESNVGVGFGGGSGVFGRTFDGTGVRGLADGGVGVRADSTTGTGLRAESVTNSAIYAISRDRYAVEGFSSYDYGVYGHSAGSNGVVGHSQTEYGVYATGKKGGLYATSLSGGLAAYFLGTVYVQGKLDAPGSSVRAVNIEPDENGTRNLGYAGLGWNFVVANNFTNPSDARLKTNVTDIEYGLSEVMALRPVSYSLRDGGEGTKLGLIAQEARAVVPEVVFEGDDGERLLSLDYARLVPVLIRAIQEQQIEIEALKARQ